MWERTVRIKNALPGEQVRARVLKRRRGEWLGEAYEVERPHPCRQRTPCEYYPRCGGCVLQHMRPGQQLLHKQGEVLACLESEGIAAAELLPPVSDAQFSYRTKARLGVRVVGANVMVGFRETLSNRVTRMTACLNLTPALSALIEPLRELVDALSVRERIPQIEIAQGSSHRAIVVRHLDPLAEGDIRALVAFARRNRIAVWSQGGGPDTQTLLHGQELMTYQNADFGLTLCFRPTEFTQVNEGINVKLVRHAVAALDVQAGDRVLDLFCGIGNFSLALARSGATVVGVEGSDAAVRRARQNAGFNGVAGSCEFHLLDLYDAEPLKGMNANLLLVDPPRSGVGPLMEDWVTCDIRRIVYVSCNPRTFATDAKRLQVLGFSLRRIRVYDMFPNTAHVETMGVFDRSSV